MKQIHHVDTRFGLSNKIGMQKFNRTLPTRSMEISNNSMEGSVKDINKVKVMAKAQIQNGMNDVLTPALKPKHSMPIIPNKNSTSILLNVPSPNFGGTTMQQLYNQVVKENEVRNNQKKKRSVDDEED